MGTTLSQPSVHLRGDYFIPVMLALQMQKFSLFDLEKFPVSFLGNSMKRTIVSVIFSERSDLVTGCIGKLSL